VDRIAHPDGAVRWVPDKVFPIKEDTGVVHRVAGVADDVTERKVQEEQILRAQRLQAVGTLASGIAHDLNIIFTPVLIGARFLKASVKDADEREMTSVITSFTSCRCATKQARAS